MVSYRQGNRDDMRGFHASHGLGGPYVDINKGSDSRIKGKGTGKKRTKSDVRPRFVW
jgi:hypothetical protein